MKDKWKMKHMSLRGQILRLSAAASILVCACVAAFIIGLGYTNQQQLDRSVEQAAEILSGEITSYQEELDNYEREKLALIRQVHCCILCCLIFRNIPFYDQLVII